MMTAINRELESFIILKGISDQRNALNSILEKYHVKNLEEIELLIRKGKIAEHPAYEDYLSAITIQQTLDEMKSLAKGIIEAF